MRVLVHLRLYNCLQVSICLYRLWLGPPLITTIIYYGLHGPILAAHRLSIHRLKHITAPPSYLLSFNQLRLAGPKLASVLGNGLSVQ